MNYMAGPNILANILLIVEVTLIDTLATITNSIIIITISAILNGCFHLCYTTIN